MGKWVPVEERLPENEEFDSGLQRTWHVTMRSGSVDQDYPPFEKNVIAWYEEDPPEPYIPPPKPKPGPMSLSEAVAEAERCGLDHVWFDDFSGGIRYQIDIATVSVYRAACIRWFAGTPGYEGNP